MKLITKHHKCIGKHKRLWIKRGARSMRKNVKKFIFIIIILNCLLMFNNSYGVTYKKELSIDIAYKEWTMITRYIVASQNATIRRLSPEWYNLTSEQIKELDKNNNGKIDNNGQHAAEYRFQKHLSRELGVPCPYIDDLVCHLVIAPLFSRRRDIFFLFKGILSCFHTIGNPQRINNP